MREVIDTTLKLLRLYGTPEDKISDIVNNFSGEELEKRLSALERRECDRWMKEDMKTYSDEEMAELDEQDKLLGIYDYEQERKQ